MLPNVDIKLPYDPTNIHENEYDILLYKERDVLLQYINNPPPIPTLHHSVNKNEVTIECSNWEKDTEIGICVFGTDSPITFYNDHHCKVPKKGSCTVKWNINTCGIYDIIVMKNNVIFIRESFFIGEEKDKQKLDIKLVQDHILKLDVGKARKNDCIVCYKGERVIGVLNLLVGVKSVYWGMIELTTGLYTFKYFRNTSDPFKKNLPVVAVKTQQF